MSGGAGTAWGRQGRRLLSLEQAWEAIAAEVTPSGAVTMTLDEAAGRVLAAPVAMSEDYPAFDKAMMDGYAVRAADCAEAGDALNVLGLVPAGEAPSNRVGPGEAVQINTGAPVPPGADTVVKVEDTALSPGGSSVRVLAPAEPGRNIAGQGSDRRKGDVVLTPPLRLGPAQLAAAITAGTRSVEVYREVGVGIVVTGNELVPVGGDKRPGQIFDSNGPMLAALMRQFGAQPQTVRIARDSEADLTRRFTEALARPVVVAAGGMSMGTLDLVPQVLGGLGVRWLFHGVAVKPGKPVAYGVGPDGQHVFGLPGNPVSAFLCAWLFVRMTIAGLQGTSPPRPPRRWRATTTAPLKAQRDSRTAFVPARTWDDPARGMMAEPRRWGGSADPFGLAEANALLVRTTPTEAAEAGSPVEVMLFCDEE